MIRNKLHAALLRPQDWIGSILIIAFMNGLLYTFLIPAWWRYDEPGHFEYVWIVLNKSALPSASDVDETFRRSLAVSLNKYRYYEFVTPKLNLDSQEPVFIGVPQYVNLPLYYWYVSLPLRLLPRADYAVQNYIIRIMTLGLMLASLWLIWKIVRKITPEHHPLRWMVPLFLALLPGFVELMTSISDDAGAVFTFSLFSYFAIHLIADGFRWRDALGLFISTAFCLLTKNTVWVSAILVGLVMLFALFRNRQAWVGWVVIAAIFVAGLLLTTRWGDSANWAPTYGADHPTRIQSVDAVDGDYALLFSPKNEKIAQFLPSSAIRPARGKTVTLGAWMWAAHPTEARLPYMLITTPDETATLGSLSPVSLTTQPQFFSITFQVPETAGRSWVFLSPFIDPSNPNLPQVYYDNLMLVVGELNGAPTALSGNTAQWNGQEYPNLLRNPSAEKAWFGSALEKYFGVLPIPILNWSATLATIQDTGATGAFLERIRDQLLTTFWAQPAKNYVTLLGGRPTVIMLYIITYLALLGFISALWRKRKQIHWPASFSLGLFAIILWFQTFIRGSSELYNPEFIVPFARYAAPAIAGTALIICAGWQEIFAWLQKPLRISSRPGASLFIALMAGLNFFTLLSVINFFYLPNGEVLTLLFLTVIAAFFFGIELLREKQIKEPVSDGSKNESRVAP
ncbi:MAG: hypothetical protein Fur0016_06720 [Anaerolineales bacterium]